MATETEANRAREQYADLLRSLGAHSIAVDEMSRRGKKAFAVIALFEEKPPGVDRDLEVKVGKRTVKVPLIARQIERFRPE